MDSLDFPTSKHTLWHQMGTRLHPSHILVLSFLLIIFIGTVLLKLPISHRGCFSVLDSLFTATSATCVTGLIVVDTATDFTPFGQGVILALIQIGGLGIMTFSTFFAYLFAGGRLSIRNRDLVERSFAGVSTHDLGKILLAVVMGTFLIEAIGAVVLTVRFSEIYPSTRALQLGVFHSISAFCNAGFSLFSKSLMGFENDIVINVTVMILIVLGGIGFWVLFDLLKCAKSHRSFWRLSLHTKLVLTMSGSLIVGGFVLLLIFEWNQTLKDLPLGTKALVALFQSITTRTAGFNTVPIQHLTNSSLFLMILLMMIGASPGSCGGGIKTTTFGVLSAMILSRLKDRRQVSVFQRGIPESIISKTIVITFFWLMVVTVVTMILLFTEHPGGPHAQGRVLFLNVLFETFSAMGTVGLSMGLTSALTPVGKVLIVLLMYMGRIGPMTIALAIVYRERVRFRLAEEDFMVG